MRDAGAVGIKYRHRLRHIGYGHGVEAHLRAVAADVATLYGEGLELEELRVVGHLAGGEASEGAADVVDTHQHVEQPGERPGCSGISHRHDGLLRLVETPGEDTGVGRHLKGVEMGASGRRHDLEAVSYMAEAGD